MSTYRPRVLVIDDDPLYRSLMTTLLRKDYLLAVAANGAEGFQKALQHTPDIVIIDIQMPGWNGLETLDEFRKHPILKNVKAVILTSDASKESVVSAIERGANDYVIKTSFSRDEFLEKMKRLNKRNVIPVTNQASTGETVSTQNKPYPGHLTTGTSKDSQNSSSHEAKSKSDSSTELVNQDTSDTDVQNMIDSWD